MGQLSLFLILANLLVLVVVYIFIRRRYQRIINSLYSRSITDSLTQLFDRSYFDQRLTEEIERVRRYKTPVAVLMMDIDDFKKYNDAHGHQAGDKLLREISDVIRHSIRRIDLSSRYGGEEFAVMLPVTPVSGAQIAAERIRDRVEELSREQGKNVTISIGIVSYEGEPSEITKDELINVADQAMYEAKNAGKNCVRFREMNKSEEAMEE